MKKLYNLGTRCVCAICTSASVYRYNYVVSCLCKYRTFLDILGYYNDNCLYHCPFDFFKSLGGLEVKSADS